MSEQSALNDKTLNAFRRVEQHFHHVEDYRRQGSIKHKLIHIIFFTLCAVTAGANDLVAVSAWTEANANWLRDLFKLKY